MDHDGSTMSAPKVIKKFIAAGTNIHQENSKPIKKINQIQILRAKLNFSLFWLILGK